MDFLASALTVDLALSDECVHPTQFSKRVISFTHKSRVGRSRTEIQYRENLHRQKLAFQQLQGCIICFSGPVQWACLDAKAAKKYTTHVLN